MFPNKNELCFMHKIITVKKIAKIIFLFSILHTDRYFKPITHMIYSEFMFLMLYADNSCLRSSKAQIQNQ